MKQRIKKIDRLIKVQQHLHKCAELQLASLHRKETELQTAQEALLQTMGEADALHGLFVDVLSKRLKALSLEEARTQVEIVQQKALTIEKALQVKRSEKMHSRLQEESHRIREKQELAAMLEAMAQKARTSLP